jgi:FemAB-related protein (PEP-CTERM system-associated)
MTTTILPPIPSSRSAVNDAPARAPVVVRPACDPASIAAWARYVARAADASLFHQPDWCAAVKRVFGHRPLHLLALRGDQTVGVLPLMEVNSLVAGRMHISVPYGTYGGLLADDEEVVQALAAEATRVADERRARVLDLRSATARVPGFEDVSGYLGFIRELPAHPNDVPAFLPKRARAAARHAHERDGISIQHDVRLARTVWQLYCRSMRRLSSLNYPYRFFAELLARLGERAWVSVAWQGVRPVAGTISFVFRDTVMPYILGADERVRCDGAANLLYLSVMERAVRSGLRYFDYGRSRADNAGAVGFKKNQGFEPRPLGYQRYVPPGQRPPDLKPSNPRFALARRVWRRLPLPVTRRLGAWAARSIPG